jgi:hypothetical protein
VQRRQRDRGAGGRAPVQPPNRRPDLVVRWVRANGDAIQWMKEDFDRTYALYKKFEAFRGFTAGGAPRKAMSHSREAAACTIGAPLGKTACRDRSHARTGCR